MRETDNPYAAPTTAEPAAAVNEAPELHSRMPGSVVCSLASLSLFATAFLGLAVYLLIPPKGSLPIIGMFVAFAVAAVLLLFGVATRSQLARRVTIVACASGGALLTVLATPVLWQFLSRLQQGQYTSGFAGEVAFRLIEWLLVASSFTAAGTLRLNSAKRWFR